MIGSSALSSATVSGLRGGDIDEARGRARWSMCGDRDERGIAAKYGAEYGCVRGTLGGELEGWERTDGAERADTAVDVEDTLDRREWGSEGVQGLEDVSASWNDVSILRGVDRFGDDKLCSERSIAVGIRSQ